MSTKNTDREKRREKLRLIVAELNNSSDECLMAVFELDAMRLEDERDDYRNALFAINPLIADEISKRHQPKSAVVLRMCKDCYFFIIVRGTPLCTSNHPCCLSACGIDTDATHCPSFSVTATPF